MVLQSKRGSLDADLVLYNATLRRAEAGHPVTALGIRNGKVVATGSDSELAAMRCPRMARLDLRGRAVLRGFTDSHLHLLSLGLGLGEPDLGGAESAAAAARMIEARRSSVPEGGWIVGRGWDHSVWRGGLPCRADLDGLVPDHPVLLRRKCGHLAWVNGVALKRARIDRHTPDPPGGRINRDASTGEPTGILSEAAISLVSDLVPLPDSRARAGALLRASAHLHGMGVTEVHSMEGRESLRGCAELRAEGRLRLRVTVHVPVAEIGATAELGLSGAIGEEWLTVGGVKAFADGSLGGLTAAMLKPYEGTRAAGVQVRTRDDLEELIREAAALGLPVCVHAIGDRANRAVLDGLEATRGVWENLSTPPRVEHAQILHSDDVSRFARLGLTASMQPIHCTQDMGISDRWLGERGKEAYRFASLISSGARVIFGSDAPVESPSVLNGIHAAVTRRRADGSPGPEGWYPLERITVAQAVQAYGSGGIDVGTPADLVVLSQDPSTADPEQLPEIKILGTLGGGEVVYGSQGDLGVHCRT